GYHSFECGGAFTTLAVAPRQCFNVADAAGTPEARLWALAVQIYSLRRAGDGPTGRAGDGGIGDFSALSQFAVKAANEGAAGLVLSPVHAAFASDPHHFSPYAPSSRQFLNPLHADPGVVFGGAAVDEAIAHLGLGETYAALERSDYVDWLAATPAKLAVLRHLFDVALPRMPDLAADFHAFRTAGGPSLDGHARFEAIHGERFRADTGQWHWRSWPEALRDPHSAEVSNFARLHAGEVTFHAFLQFVASRSLTLAQNAARSAGMPIGLISDLAIGTDGGGSQAWSRQDEMLIGLSVGAPPDLMNAIGQTWGLAAFSPRALVRTGFSVFREMLAATMGPAGGVRIDHVMGLMRLWMVPDGAAARDGAYLAYP
ncbi:MAG: 4-alpha-glucanotransferase, partial [Azorhizobium sp. 12-66-6]